MFSVTPRVSCIIWGLSESEYAFFRLDSEPLWPGIQLAIGMYGNDYEDFDSLEWGTARLL
eukprot:4586648-Amphidinium_carterae.1